MSEFQIKLSGLEKFSQLISDHLEASDIITLSGDLGSGKTKLAEELINALSSQKQNVTSPTFNLLQIYDAKNTQIYHYDLYRLEDEKEILELDIDNAFENAISIIEWPEKAAKYIPSDALAIDIAINQDTRIYKIKESQKWHKLIKKLQENFL